MRFLVRAENKPLVLHCFVLAVVCSRSIRYIQLLALFIVSFIKSKPN